MAELDELRDESGLCCICYFCRMLQF